MSACSRQGSCVSCQLGIPAHLAAPSPLPAGDSPLQSWRRRKFPGLGFCVTSSSVCHLQQCVCHLQQCQLRVIRCPWRSWCSAALPLAGSAVYRGQVWKAVPGKVSKCAKLEPKLLFGVCWGPKTQLWGMICSRFVHLQHPASRLVVLSSLEFHPN